MPKLTGKVALVTGGNSGIGLAAGRRFVDDGAFVFNAARRKEELERAKMGIGRNVSAVQTDVSARIKTSDQSSYQYELTIAEARHC
jgi:NAD(P)-dependent dehydrogenase (short-subunit alcohol dehydrogenase family)